MAISLRLAAAVRLAWPVALAPLATVGTGLYTLKEFVPDDHLTMVRIPTGGGLARPTWTASCSSSRAA